MSSEVQVYNAAAAAIGSGTRVTSPDDDTTIARSIKGVWELNRRAAIREGSWNFATRRARLPAMVAKPEFGFEYQYQIPAGCLRLIEVRSGSWQVDDFQLEGGKILTDRGGPLDIRYLVDVAEPAEWDEGFAHAFALRIAFQIGTKIAGSSFDKQKVWQDYQDALAASKRVDAMENPPIEREESDWVTARHASAFWNPRV